ncbi:cytochrome P450 [Hypoxylon crocopeplum]|nr:cytochrome P450 [Hypoxylon crocopeplum]
MMCTYADNTECAVVFAYYVFLHPLKDYPGPLLAKVTDAYAGYHAIMMRLHLTTWEDHERYGRVIRHGPNKLVFNSAQALRDIYLNDRLSKSRVYLTTLQASTGENVWSTIDKRTHRSRQRIVGAVFNDHFMRQFEPVIIKEIGIFLGLILKACQTPGTLLLDMTDQFHHLTLDIVGQLAFGHANNTQTKPKGRFLVKGLMVANYHNNVLMQFPYLAQSWLVSLMHRLTARRQQKNLDSLRKIINRRISQGMEAKYDLYHVVTKHVGIEDAKDVKLSELWSEAAMFYVAGGETSSTTMSALFFYLSRNQECYCRLTSEIRSTFTDGADIRRGQKLLSCRYLRACIDEALRISPPGPGTFWREAPHDDTEEVGPLIIDGHVISPGTQVGVCTYAIHHNEEYFPEPFVFRPERWLIDNTLDRPQQAFVPFSIGSRSCPGKPLAYLEISLTVAKTLWYFDFERPSGSLGDIGGGRLGRRGGRGRTDEFQLYDIFASTHKGPILSFSTRDEFWRELETL